MVQVEKMLAMIGIQTRRIGYFSLESPVPSLDAGLSVSMTLISSSKSLYKSLSNSLYPHLCPIWSLRHPANHR